MAQISGSTGWEIVVSSRSACVGSLAFQLSGASLKLLGS